MYGGDVHIIRHPEASLPAHAGDAHGDDVLIAVDNERMQRQTVDKAAVGIELSAELFETEARVIGAGKQHIAYLVLRQIVDLYFKTLAVGQGDSGDKQLHIGLLDLLHIDDLAHPRAQRRDVKPAVADDLEHLRDELLNIAKLELAVHGLVQILLALLVKLDDLGKTHIVPCRRGAGQVAHRHERTV